MSKSSIMAIALLTTATLLAPCGSGVAATAGAATDAAQHASAPAKHKKSHKKKPKKPQQMSPDDPCYFGCM